MGLEAAIFTSNSPTLMFPHLHKATVDGLRSLAATFSDLDALVVVSPHFMAKDGFLVNVAQRPEFLQDYYGFPADWYKVRYEPTGDPELGHALVTEGKKNGVPVEATTEWGIDHGAWTPLLHLVPEARVPVVCLSISNLFPAEHRRWGAAIRRAIDGSGKRVAFVATGALSHRLDMITWGVNQPFPEAERYDQGVIELLKQGKFDAIERVDQDLYRAAAPEGNNGPLYILLGVIGAPQPVKLVSYERMYTGVSLATVRFQPGPLETMV